MPVTNAQDMAKAGSLINSDGTTVSVAADLLIADKLVHTGDTNTAIRFPAADTVTVETAGTERVRVDSSGNVGIGTSSPAYSLEVAVGTSGQQSIANFRTADSTAANNAGIQIFATSSSTAASRNVKLVFDSDGANASGGDYFIITKDGNSGAVSLDQQSNSAMTFNTNATERLRIDSSGNVGIGTNSPNGKLHVNGGIRASGEVTAGGASAIVMDFSSGISRFISSGSDASTQAGFSFFTANSTSSIANERLRIDSSGLICTSQKINLGSISSYGYAWGSNSKRHIDTFYTSMGEEGNGYQAFVVNGYESTSGGTWKYKVSSLGATRLLSTFGDFRIDTAPSGTANNDITWNQRFLINLNGAIDSQATYDNTAAGSTVIVTSAGRIARTSSSLKYKKDIEILEKSLVENSIDNLRPIWYRTKNPEGDDKSTWSHIGLIAEEVSLVEPRLVKYKTVEVSVGKNGERVETQLENPIPEDVDYARLSVILLSEVKAQKIKIASLEARIEALEAA